MTPPKTTLVQELTFYLENNQYFYKYIYATDNPVRSAQYQLQRQRSVIKQTIFKEGLVVGNLLLSPTKIDSVKFGSVKNVNYRDDDDYSGVARGKPYQFDL